MADIQTSSNTAPVTFNDLLAERNSFWSSFTGAIVIATSAVVGLLILMRIFLV